MKQSSRKIWNRRGFSLVGAMVGASVLAIAILGFAQYMATQYKTVRRINQKFAAMKVEQLLTRAMSDPLVCGCLLTSLNSGTLVPTGETDLTNLTPDTSPTCASAGPGVPIATVGQPLEGNELLGIFTTRIFISDVSLGTPILGLPPLTEYSGSVNITFGNEPTPGASNTIAAPVRAATAQFFFLVNGAGNIDSCKGSNFDRYFQTQVDRHTNTQTDIREQADDAIAEVIAEVIQGETDIDAVVDAAEGQMSRTATSTVNNIKSERILIVAQARALIESLRPPPPPPPLPAPPPASGPGPASPPPPAYDCSSFNGSSASLSSASHFTSDLIRVRGRGGVPAGATGIEFLVDGLNRGSYPAASGTVNATIGTYVSGTTVAVKAVTIDNNGCRSRPSNTINVTIP